MRRPITVLLLIAPMLAQAEAVTRKAGRAAGEFGAGVAEVLGEGFNQGISGMQAQWITIAPRSKDECFAESGGVSIPLLFAAGMVGKSSSGLIPKGTKLCSANAKFQRSESAASAQWRRCLPVVRTVWSTIPVWS